MNRIIDRLDIYLSHRGINDNKATEILGLSVGTISKSRKEGRDFSKTNVEKALNIFQDLDRVWLLTGEGSMLKSEVDAGAIMVADNEEAYKKAIESGMSLIPEYSTPYHGGDGLVSEADHVVAYWSMPNIPSNSRIITMYGDSMEPTIMGGSKLAVQPISFSSPTEIPFGNVFAVAVQDEWGMINTHVKIIRRHTDKQKESTHWIARSVNRENYDDFDIDISRVLSLCVMVMNINRAI